jgi:hypothetical protein
MNCVTHHDTRRQVELKVAIVRTKRHVLEIREIYAARRWHITPIAVQIWRLIDHDDDADEVRSSAAIAAGRFSGLFAPVTLSSRVATSLNAERSTSLPFMNRLGSL